MGTQKPDVIQFRLSGKTVGEIALRREGEDRANQTSTWALVYQESGEDATRRVNKTFTASSWADPFTLLMIAVTHLRAANIDLGRHIRSEPATYLGIDAIVDRRGGNLFAGEYKFVSVKAEDLQVGQKIAHSGKLYEIKNKFHITETSCAFDLYWPREDIVVHKVFRNTTLVNAVDETEQKSA